MKQASVSVIPLGGVGEIGKNMWLVESQGEILVMDAGMMIPSDELLGVDVVIPDFSYLLQNKDRAMRMLRAKLAALAEEQAAAAASDARRAQVRTVDRSERIRTYNFPQNRITDHRIGYTAYNLDLVLAGELDGVLDALAEAARAARLAGDGGLTR